MRKPPNVRGAPPPRRAPPKQRFKPAISRGDTPREQAKNGAKAGLLPPRHLSACALAAPPKSTRKSRLPAPCSFLPARNSRHAR